MAWKDKLQPATFRGVPFEVESDDGSFGRRTQVHEYPQRDMPYAEDLGRATREINVTAFLIGDDYLDARDKLLEALETAGPGTLVHPWYGELKVSLKDPARVSHSIANGGMCTVQLSFVEAGELAFPSAGNSLGAKSLEAADRLQDAGSFDYVEKFDVNSKPSAVFDDAVKTFNDGCDLIDNATSNIKSILDHPMQFLKDNARTLIPDAFAMADTVFGLFKRGESVVDSITSMFGGGGASARNSDTVAALTSLSRTFSDRAATAQAVANSASTATSTVSPSRAQAATNAAALNHLFSQSMLVQAVGMTTTMDLPIYDDAVKIRNDVTAALDNESLAVSDPVYVVLQDARAAVYADVTGRLSQSARLKTITPRAIMPAIVTAYDQFEDVAREGEIVDLNKIRRPGFVPAEPIKVLSV
ncbi:multidrug DMT transporter [Caballeronia novacaledonica]|uniref:Multidrug DMT transporter n=1 Tax=Caballeronia novacaledonica TaxID=1544861 RepID=A0A2U3I8K8_9BURK|nr:DNA circularization N-terminal domain-containing protein [Caballeronia novacaledonica]SPB16531.1 multidrug DMT transporter [Caballeronia novacaledonica]